jgi:hypothetical protein
MAARKTPSSDAKVSATSATPVPSAPTLRSETKGSGTAKAKPAAVEVNHETISKRAYEIYASRGFASGNPDEDWREAERQLKAGL